jgi:two-component system sensor histidine kinase PhoQ
MISLHGRVALSAGLVLAVFVLLTGFALDRAFHDSVRAAHEERLLGQIYLLLTAADPDEEGRELLVPEALPEARFNLAASGLYGEIRDERGNTVWRSTSTIGVSPPFSNGLRPGEKRFERREDADGTPYFIQSHGVSWVVDGTPRTYTFSVAEDLDEFTRELNEYRTSLATWLGGMAVLLLAVLGLTLRWGLRPLRKVRREIERVQTGDRERVVGTYPAELQGLTGSVNALLGHERAQQKRLRNALGDLAHSLKTPLAVMRGAIGDGRVDAAVARELDDQLGQMDRIVRHQLQRAIARGETGIGARVSVLAVAEKMKASLAKLHREKGMTIELEIAPDLHFRGAEGDLMEMLGNLLDNACKWCRREVRLAARRHDSALEFTVEDDGRGMDPALAERLMERGARADETVPGHGIGLAIVRDIAAAYAGRITVARSRLGGAAIVVRLPG